MPPDTPTGPPIRTVAAGGIRFATASTPPQGTGGLPPVLLLGDPPNGIEAMWPLAQRIADRHHVTVVDPPGFGHTPAPRGFPFTIDAYAAALRALLEALDGGPWIIAAPCVVGLGAVRLATQHPDHVAGLVLSQTPSYADTRRWVDRVDRHGHLRRAALGPLVLRLRREAVVRQWLHVAEPDAAQRSTLLAAHKSRRRADRRFRLAPVLGHLADSDPLEGARYLGPAAVLWGGADRTHRGHAADGITQHLDHARVSQIDGAGHFPDLSAPEAFEDALAHVTTLHMAMTRA